jgi:hypothetical protein
LVELFLKAQARPTGAGLPKPPVGLALLIGVGLPVMNRHELLKKLNQNSLRRFISEGEASSEMLTVKLKS